MQDMVSALDDLVLGKVFLLSQCGTEKNSSADSRVLNGFDPSSQPNNTGSNHGQHSTVMGLGNLADRQAG